MLTSTDPDAEAIQPGVIWLSPSCVGCSRYSSYDDGQQWCTEPQDPCEECGLEWTRYTRDEAQAVEAREAQSRQETAA